MTPRPCRKSFSQTAGKVANNFVAGGARKMEEVSGWGLLGWRGGSWVDTSLGGIYRVEWSLTGGEGGGWVPVRRPNILRFCFLSIFAVRFHVHSNNFVAGTQDQQQN